MKEIISGKRKFEVIDIEKDKLLNFVTQSEKKVINIIKHLKDEGKITEKIYDKIFSLGSRPGILYGLPKVHKPVIDNCPKFCPILSATGAPTFKLAKFLAPILSPLTVNEFSVRNSFSFTNEVSSFCPDHYILLDEVINICVNDLFSDNDTIHNLDKNDLRELLTLAS